MKSCTVSDTGRTNQNKKNTNITSDIIHVSSLNSSTLYVTVAPCLFTLLPTASHLCTEAPRCTEVMVEEGVRRSKRFHICQTGTNHLWTEEVAFNITYHPPTMQYWVPSPDNLKTIHTWAHLTPWRPNNSHEGQLGEQLTSSPKDSVIQSSHVSLMTL